MKFLLFSSIKLVKGAKNSLLIDTQRFKYYVINKNYLNILEALYLFTLEEITQDLSLEDEKIVNDFVENMCNEEFGFLSELDESFPINIAQENLFTFCNKITTSIIEIRKNNLSQIITTLSQIVDMGCLFIEIRCLDILSMKELHKVLSIFDDSLICSINLVMPYTGELDDKSLIASLCKLYYRINVITVFNSPVSKSEAARLYTINYILKNINSICCGVVEKRNFHSNILFYNESKSWNTCLNKKISVDSNGNIKNCPSMKKSYGNIKDTTLQEALDHPDFKQYWNINKDKIHVCKDCEFRRICTDCRAYIENPDDIYSKPLKCGYNPYTCEWEEWSTNPLKQKAIDFYGMREMVEKEKQQEKV